MVADRYEGEAGSLSGAVLIFNGPLDGQSVLTSESASVIISPQGFDTPDNIASGDLNGDGITDLVVRSGDEILAFWGPVESSAVPDGQLLVEDDSGASFGNSLAIADVTGDSAYDLIVGAPGGLFALDAGYVSVFAGPFSAETPEPRDSAAPDARLEGSSGLGSLVAAHDVNGDGQLDLITSARDPQLDASKKRHAGQVAIFLGPVQGELTLQDAHALFEGENIGDDSGARFSLGDANNDGQADLIAPNNRFQPPLASSPAAPRPIYVMYGPLQGQRNFADADRTFIEGTREDFVSDAILTNADGVGGDDILIGASGIDTDEDNIGRLYLFPN